MTDQYRGLPLSGLRLVAHLNDELRLFERSHYLRCGCRVVNVSPGTDPLNAALQVDFLGDRYDAKCLKFVQDIISRKT